METLVFATALGHIACARSGKLVHALSFGHASESAALKALSYTLSSAAGSLTNGSTSSKSTNAKSISAKSTSFGKQRTPYALNNVESVSPGCDELVDQLLAFTAGEPIGFDRLQVDTTHLTEFGAQVTAMCRRIPWGETVTYGQLAKQVGRPGAARAVGSVMARNRVPLIVPCHRVVPAGGGLGGFSAPQGVAMKEKLLRQERSHQLVQTTVG